MQQRCHMKTNTLASIKGFACLLFVLSACVSPIQAAGKPPVPDFTQGGKPDSTHDWTLGPTGARGWVWAWRAQTTDARQILITEVAAGSPADGVLQKDDVVLGLNGQPFSDDARITFAKAINGAEKQSGALGLIRWRAGQTQNVEVKLPVLGSYAATAPYDCAKSKRIFEQGCAAIAKLGFKNRRGEIRIEIANALRALALLASGRQEYRPLLAEYATAVAACTPTQGGYPSWDYGYETLFLAEYVLATQDLSVKPGLTRLATDIATGASGVGTWGHNFARPTDGILEGYGCMNQPGIVLTMAMVAAREAGVNSPQLDSAIARSTRFIRWYVGKGAVPYGDHAPWPEHEDNGKCSSAALLFNLLGDREAAAFFSRMATAAYAERECGHTGNFFNMLWALPGVALSGPLATSAYFNETQWYYDLARGWDGRFIHQGIPAEQESYDHWDSTGAYMLAYALPLKSLLITGRKPAIVPPLSPAEVADTIASGRWNWWNGQETIYDARPTAELYGGLSSWSPTVRARSAKALAKKADASVPRLIEMLDAKDQQTRYGACVALRYLGTKADPAAPKLRALLASSEPWQRVLAAEAIVELSQPIRQASVPDLLQVVLRKGDPQDPRRCVMGPLAEVLFRPGPGQRDPDSILRKSFAPVDEASRPLLLTAIRDLMHSEDGRIRGNASSTYGKLSPKELAELMPDIVEVTRNPAPSGEMFAYDIRMSGLDLLAKLRIREGMDLCVNIMNERRWGRDFLHAERALQMYGGAAKAVLPRLQKETRAVATKEGKKQLEALDKLCAVIEADPSPKPVRSMEEFIKNPTNANQP